MNNGKELKSLIPEQTSMGKELLIEDHIALYPSKDGKVLIIPRNGENKTSNLEEYKVVPVDSFDTITFKIWKKYKIIIKKHLIPLRIALFLWYGAARIPAAFLSVFMKQRGLSVVQISSVFSFTFAFQFLSASVSGVIADKIGNAKPVLLFHMICTVFVILSMLLSHNFVDITGCIIRKSDFVCSASHIYDIMQNNLSHCIFNCTAVSGIALDLNVRQLNILQNTSLASLFPMLTDKEEIGNISHVSLINSTDNLCSDLNYSCVQSCASVTDLSCERSEKILVIIYSILILFFFTFLTTVYRFMDVIAMTLVKKYDSSFGRERFISLSGEIFVAITIAFVMNSGTFGEDDNKFDVVYWVCACFIFVSLLSVWNIRDHLNPPGRNLTRKVFTLMKSTDIVAFVVVVFVLGNAYCFNVSFHLWFLETLNAPKALFGFHALSFGLYGIPVLLTSNWWLKNLGTRRIFVLSLLCYTINASGYSFLYNPWLSLIIESTSAFTYHLLWVAVVVHSHDVAPQGLVATCNAVSGAVHYGLSRSSGVLGGGLLIDYFGPRITYRILATLCLVTATLYSIFLYNRHSTSTNEMRQKENSFQKRQEKQIIENTDVYHC